MADIISWVATAATIIAASMTAANLGSRITGYGFCVFLAGSLAWLATGVMTNVALALLNVFGIWRWLGRQSKVEEGARAASHASELTPGEALFPVSLLGRAQVTGEGRELGSCIDAMAGCSSGCLDYLVVSEGGVAGVGETLRRMPWGKAKVDREHVVAAMTPTQFEQLEILPRDQWPAR